MIKKVIAFVACSAFIVTITSYGYNNHNLNGFAGDITKNNAQKYLSMDKVASTGFDNVTSTTEAVQESTIEAAVSTQSTSTTESVLGYKKEKKADNVKLQDNQNNDNQSYDNNDNGQNGDNQSYDNNDNGQNNSNNN